MIIRPVRYAKNVLNLIHLEQYCVKHHWHRQSQIHICQSAAISFGCLLYLYGVSSWVEWESEGFIERGLSVMSTNSGLLLDDPLLSGYINHIQLHIQV